MSSSYMLDTNICSFIMRQHPKKVLERLTDEAVAGSSIYISVITYYEMQLGIRNKPSIERAVNAFVSRLSGIMSWDEQAARCAAQIDRDLAAIGNRIGPNDTMIAGHALAANTVLVTNNTREFDHVKGLQLQDWKPVAES